MFLYVGNIISFLLYVYFLQFSVISREIMAKAIPTMQTPSQSACVQT